MATMIIIFILNNSQKYGIKQGRFRQTYLLAGFYAVILLDTSNFIYTSSVTIAIQNISLVDGEELYTHNQANKEETREQLINNLDIINEVDKVSKCY